METKEKTCPACKTKKSINSFYKRSGKNAHLRRSCCIECERKGQKGNPQRIEGSRKLYRKRRAEWIFWFETLYGIAPKCQCCGLPLSFNSGVSGVVFDHRMGHEKIRVVSKWIADHAFNEANKKGFLNCNFGILCHRCNITLPTKNRIGWIKNVVGYIRKTHPEL